MSKVNRKDGPSEESGPVTHIVMMPKESLSPTAHVELNTIQVYHPRNDSTVLFVQGGQFFEVQKTQIAKYGSWFLDQRVSSNKNVLFATPFDPRFILLPYFEKAGSRYSPLEQIVHSSSIPTAANVKVPPLQFWRQWKMEEVFDVNDKLGDDMIVFRYNKDKALAWLQNKVEKVAKILAVQRKRAQRQTQPLFVTSFRSGSSFQHQHQQQQSVQEDPETAVVEDQDRRTAVELVCDNISDSLAGDLVQAFGYSVEEILSTKAATTSLKRKADWEIALEQEREEAEQNALLKGTSATNSTTTAKPATAAAPTDYNAFLKGEHANGPSQPAAKVSKTVTLNAAAAKGTKSISSFFGGKK